ncbi:MAG: hypothetical protein IPG60_12005 [Bacteroidetes bacterium]|nr:hypothetical protein [Bacteroidota bacterium]MBP8753732.1 hypothetical protein [Chitinophagales bacterium]MBK8487581.1 hypothetical protein [Bacteroidota bacterium]MBK8682673.1 hypothetical protein [Bacteroidota bacterium]MBP9189240.1 hypothetical protein [Chitinophagales bacterium]
MSNSLSEAKILLQKIQSLIDNLDITNPNSAIETDLIKDHLRKLYDITLNLKIEKEVQVPNEKPEPDIVTKIESHAFPPETISSEEIIVEETPLEEAAIKNKRIEEIINTISHIPQSILHFEETPLPIENQLEVSIIHESKNFLNEKLATEKETLADKIKPKKTNDLRTAIDLNAKFFFIKELFKSDALAYEKAIRFLNGLTSMQDAEVYINKELAINYNWQNKDAAMHKFLEAIKIKFQD